MRAQWRAPYKTHTPYPANLPPDERAAWDMESEAEVNLARKLKIINKSAYLTEKIDNVWDDWWRRRDQTQDLNQVWDVNRDGTTNHKLRQERQEVVDLRLKEVRVAELDRQVWESLMPARWARMP